MKPEKQKDALTDLIEIVSTPVASDDNLREGEVSTPEGDRVTLGFRGLAQRLLNAVRIKRQNEEVVRKQLSSRDKK